MICSECERLAATTMAQLETRRRNAEKYPDVSIYSCRACGGTEWALTDKFVKDRS